MKKVLISTSSFDQENVGSLKLLENAGFKVVLNPHGRKLSEGEILELLSDTDYLIAGTEPLTRRVLESSKQLKIISRCGAGLDNVDMLTATRRGIKVFNTPDVPTLAVAELTIGLLLNLLRKVSQMDSELRTGLWEKRMGNLLCGKKVGIKGFGRIGKKVAELLMPFGCDIAYADPFVDDGLLGLKRLPLEDLLAWADIVTIHIGAKEKLIAEKEFQLMKKGAWLINTSRGGVVDESLLYEYLKKGYLSGAALDVFEQEPYIGSLKELNNVILTPHIGSYAKEARTEMEMESVRNLLNGLEKK